jgi:protein-disulfide isomerase
MMSTSCLKGAALNLGLLLSILVTSSAGWAQGGVINSGGGGTDVALEFQHCAARAIVELRRIIPLSTLDPKPLELTLANAKIYVTQKPLFIGKGRYRQSVVAKNYPSKQLIVINEKRWRAIRSNVRKESLALHEVLSLKRIEGTGNYKYSQQYYSVQSPSVPVTFTELMVPQTLNTLEDPKVTVVVFEDFMSPFEGMQTHEIEKVIQKYGDQVQFVVRNFPLTVVHPLARTAALAGICANMQSPELFRSLRAAFLSYAYDRRRKDINDEISSDEKLWSVAQTVRGLDVSEVKKCVDSPAAQLKLDADTRQFTELHAIGTPTSVVSAREVNMVITGARTFEQWDQAIAVLLAR